MLYSKSDPWSINEISSVTINSLKETVLRFYDEWLLDTSRQALYATHENTFMYELIWFDHNWVPGSPVRLRQTNKLTGKASEELNNIFSKLSQTVDGQIVHAEIVSMSANSRIRTHRDLGDALYLARRFHVPIKTNSKIFFTVEDEKFFLEEGKIYELNNSKYHGVRNESDEARIHLLVDVMPNEYFEGIEEHNGEVRGTPSYYLCPFCISTWVCSGPHIEEKDVASFYKKLEIVQEDLGEYAKELILKNINNKDPEALAAFVEESIKNRSTI
jgi:hypothetical protein